MSEVSVIEPDPRSEPAASSADLTERVLAVAGVAALFAPRATVSELPGVVTALVTRDPGRSNRIQLVATDASVRADVRLGVDCDARTPVTARAVADTLLAEFGGLPGAVHVQVARIG